jgi:CYTH domain-containing protein/CHAD domain-containing protein
VLDPGDRTQREVRRVARERPDGAIAHLDDALDGGEIETAVHEARKRCKACRGLARLVRPALGDRFGEFDRIVRSAANQLSELRDAHALLGALDVLVATAPHDVALRGVRDQHATRAATVTASATETHERLASARALLVEARDASQHWKIPHGFDAIEAGLMATYRRGRADLRRSVAGPTDHRLHEWRKSVKYLWYQMQLLRDASPTVLGPLGEQLDLLSEALGDDHDLAVLIELLHDRPEAYGTDADVTHVTDVARRRQQQLRAGAFRTGATIYAESEAAFVQRVATYWRLTVRDGTEPIDHDASGEAPASSSTVERERKFLIDPVPAGLDVSRGTPLRQGYLVAGDTVSVRVRDAGSEGRTLTIKAGDGAERTELEWSIDRPQFEAAWALTGGRRIDKTRHRIPLEDAVVIELDVFAGELAGLVFAEVEFDSSEALAAFTPPDWFGPEVTDDGRYTNASLALHGRPPPR